MLELIAPRGRRTANYNDQTFSVRTERLADCFTDPPANAVPGNRGWRKARWNDDAYPGLARQPLADG